MRRSALGCLTLALAAAPLTLLSPMATAAPPKVTAKASAASLDEGDVLTVTGRATGSAARKVALQERVGRRWRDVAVDPVKVGDGGRYLLSHDPARGDHRFRVTSLRRDRSVLARSAAFDVAVHWTPTLDVAPTPGWDDDGRVLVLTGTTDPSVVAVRLQRRLGDDGAWEQVDEGSADPAGAFSFERRDVAAAQFRVVVPAAGLQRKAASPVFTNPGLTFGLPVSNGVTFTGLQQEDQAAQVDLELDDLHEVSLAGIGGDGADWEATVTGPTGTVGTLSDEDPVLRFAPTSTSGYSVRLAVTSGSTWTLWSSTPADLTSGQSVLLVPGQVAERVFTPDVDQEVSVSDTAGDAVTRTMRASDGTTPPYLEHDPAATGSGVYVLEGGQTYRYRLVPKTLTPLDVTPTISTS